MTAFSASRHCKFTDMALNSHWKTWLKKFFSPFPATLLICLLAAYLRSQELAQRSFSGDEIFQYNNMIGPFKHFWRHLYYGDHTIFPGDYLLSYPFVALFGLNKWALAIPHILMTLAGFYLLYKLCQRFCASIWGYVIAFMMVTFNANLIFHSFEFRPYAVLPTLALANFYYSDKLMRRYEGMSSRPKILLGIYFFISFNFHAYGILIFLLPLTFSILFNLKGKGQGWWQHPALKYFGLIVAIALPVWLWYAWNNHFGLGPNPASYAPKDTFQYIPNPVTNFIGFSKGIVGNLVGCKSLYFLMLGCLLSFLIPHNQRQNQVLFLSILVIIPLGLILLVDIASQYWFLQRQFVWIMPLFGFYTGWCWDSILLLPKTKIP